VSTVCEWSRAVRDWWNSKISVCDPLPPPPRAHRKCEIPVCERGHTQKVAAPEIVRNNSPPPPPPPRAHRKCEIPVCEPGHTQKVSRQKLSAIIYSQTHKRLVLTHRHAKIRVWKGAGEGGWSHTQGVVGV